MGDPRARSSPGSRRFFPSLPPLPSPLPSLLPKNVPLRGEWLRPEVTPPSPARPFFSSAARRAGLVRLRRGQGADGWEPGFGRGARVGPRAHFGGRDWREPAAGLRRGEPVKCGNLTLSLRLRSRSCLGDLHCSYPVAFPEAKSPGNAHGSISRPAPGTPSRDYTHPCARGQPSGGGAETGPWAESRLVKEARSGEGGVSRRSSF